jgi:hypothetical protein
LPATSTGEALRLRAANAITNVRCSGSWNVLGRSARETVAGDSHVAVLDLRFPQHGWRVTSVGSIPDIRGLAAGA